jgi:3-hydroxymyristoyl/3-hydroxydecanoyl-(acyl carrier protein) dehydratase
MSSILKKTEIKKILKIKEPFLMIDKVKIISQNKLSEGIKELKKNDWYFKCHFYNNDPVFPGTLQTEAMLQNIIILLFRKNEKIKKYFIIKSDTYFYLKITKPCKFKIKSRIISNNKGAVQSESEIFLKNKKISSGKFRFIDPELFKVGIK